MGVRVREPNSDVDGEDEDENASAPFSPSPSSKSSPATLEFSPSFLPVYSPTVRIFFDPPQPPKTPPSTVVATKKSIINLG